MNFNPAITLKVDRSNFDEVFKEYQRWSKRQPAEIVNAKLYFIARHAVNTTKKATPEQIRTDLGKPSRFYRDLTVGEALAIAQHRKTKSFPKKRATLARQLPVWAQRLQSNRLNRIGFLASGWLPAVRKLDLWNRKGDITFVRRFAPKIEGKVRQFGADKGDVKPARLEQAIVSGWIQNDVGTGPQASARVKSIKQEGLDKAVVEEIRSMVVYIQRKWQEQFDRMRRKDKGFA